MKVSSVYKTSLNSNPFFSNTCSKLIPKRHSKHHLNLMKNQNLTIHLSHMFFLMKILGCGMLTNRLE